MRVSEADDRREIALAVGESLELVLSEASGSGFKWAFISRGESILVLEREYLAADSAPGSGRMRCWLFRVTASGKATLELGYARPWEKGPPARSFILKLHTSGPP
jgi:predicted secreted protein